MAEVRQEAENELNQTEIREFQTRIAILQNELIDKNKEIELIDREREKMRMAQEHIMDNVNTELKDQTDEID